MPRRYSPEIAVVVARARITAGSVLIESGCVEWNGKHCKDGYARCFAILDGVRLFTAHKIAYWLKNGPVPEGLEVDHMCRNRGCLNDEHLRLLPHAENSALGDHVTNHRNSKKTHCPAGHPLSEGNVIESPSKNGVARKCRTCHNARRNHYYHTKIKLQKDK